MSSEGVKIITTSDGSHSLYNESIKETYHSTHGAITESQHVFIKEGIQFLVDKGCKVFNILEVGFGTGLNALLAYDYALKNKHITISYTTLEPYPLTEEIFSNLNYLEQLDTEISQEDFLHLHHLDFGNNISIQENFSFTKHKKELQSFKSKDSFNLVFYDAFAPNKQSEMWSLETLKVAFELMQSSGFLVTYCSQGQFKRDLTDLGFEVQSIDGPPGKKEMTRAIK